MWVLPRLSLFFVEFYMRDISGGILGIPEFYTNFLMVNFSSGAMYF